LLCIVEVIVEVLLHQGVDYGDDLANEEPGPTVNTGPFRDILDKELATRAVGSPQSMFPWRP
jgi:hypothetical protein